MIKEMDPLCLVFQSRKVNKNFILYIRKVLQAMAVEARITARPLSQNSQFGKLKNCIDESRNYFKRMIGPRDKKEWPICYNQISRIISSCLILPVHYPTLSKAFQSIFAKLGRYIAGDEKLWHFTGASSCVRLVPSKPGKLGLWMYELCCTLPDGSAYLLYFRMHDNRQGAPVPVADVVKEWANVILTVGKTGEANPNPYTMLVFDSYYTSKDGQNIYHVYCCVHQKTHQAYTFRSCLVDLADQIYMYSLEFPD